jgi:hypothetical protein
MPAWREVRLLVSRELGEPVSLGDEECAEIFAILDRLQAAGSN